MWTWGRASLAVALLNLLAQLAVLVGFFAYQRWLVAHDDRAIGAIAGGTSRNWFWFYLALMAAGVALAVTGLIRREKPRYLPLAGFVANLVAPLAAIALVIIVSMVLRALL